MYQYVKLCRRRLRRDDILEVWGDVVFSCSTGNYVLLMFGRLEVESAVAAGRLSIEGSPDQAKNFNVWFKGF